MDEEIFAANEQEKVKAIQKANNAIKAMKKLDEKRTKDMFIALLDCLDVRIAIRSAIDLNRNYDLDVELKNKVRNVRKLYCSSKYCTPIEEVGLIGWPDVPRTKKKKKK